MKRILSVLITALLFFTSSYAQQTGENNEEVNYLTVKGLKIEPNLTMQKTYEHLIGKGMKTNEMNDYMYSNNGMYVLQGTFQNIQDCKVMIMPLESDKSIVSQIAISLPDRDTFAQLKNDYDNLKSGLLAKYYLYDCEEQFYDSYTATCMSDKLKLYALENDECKFRSEFYPFDNDLAFMLGRAVLVISHLTVDYIDYYHVNLIYCTPNNAAEQLQNMDDL